MRAANGTRIFEIRNRTEPIENQGSSWNLEYTCPLGERWIQQLRKKRQNAAAVRPNTPPFTQKELLDLAAECDAGIAKLEPRPSEATRNLRKTQGAEVTPQ